MTSADKNAVERIHDNTIRILSELGMAFHNQEALRVLKESGVEVRGNRAYFQERQVMDALSKTAKSFTIYARNPKYDVTVDTEALHLLPGYGSSYVADTAGNLRVTAFSDYLRLADIVQQSDAFSLNGGILAQPCDIESRLAAPAMIYALLKRSDKALFGVSADGKLTEQVISLLAIAFGDDFYTKPRIITMLSTMSPLAVDGNALETMLVCAKYRQPLIVAPGPMAGGTGPISLSGNLSLANAEILGFNTLIQTVSPGLPIVYGFAATTSDMRDMSVCNASPGFLKQARFGALLAKRYGLPCRSGGGMSDAGGLTAQAGVESALGLFESFSEKANIIVHAAGSLHSFASLSYEKFVLDIETADRLRYYFSPLPDEEDDLAFDVIKDTVETGVQAMLHEHTLLRCREDPWKPQISLHGRSKGEPNAELYAAAGKRLRELLESYTRPSLGEEADKRLDEFIKALGLGEQFIDSVNYSRGTQFQPII